MIFKIIFALWLVAAAVCDDKMDDVVTLSTSDPEPSTNAPLVPNQPCDIDGEPGECTPNFLCDDKEATDRASGTIDIAGQVSSSRCSFAFEVCCPVKSQKSTLDIPPKREGCGWRNPLGIDRDEEGFAKIAEFPWMCAILKVKPEIDEELKDQKINQNGSLLNPSMDLPSAYVNSNDKDLKEKKISVYEYVGGGSLIHPSVVLTAAHVAASPQLLVRAGEWDTQTVKEPLPHQDREVASIVVHQDYIKQNLFYDIALLFLSTPMELAPNVGVACLPPPRERTRAASRCFATGWGKDKFGKEGRYQVILKKVEVPVVDHATCQTQLRKTRLGSVFTLHTSFMCAGGEKDKDACTGDGGSPLSCPIEFEDGRYMQSGIVAWSIGCGILGTPGVYVDVANLRSWVDDKIAGKGYDPKTYSF